MKDKELQFDREKHLLYSKTAKKVIWRHLAGRVPASELEPCWEKIQLAYVKNLALIPYLGGKRNMQAASVYDAAALFAFYETVEEKPGPEEFEEMNNELFLTDSNRKWGRPDLNRRFFMGIARRIWTGLSKSSRKHREDWPGNYIMEMQPVEEGCKYVFRRCPIAELAKKLGYEQLMPALCNPDYAALKQMHAGLIRTGTCAFGDSCDFWIVGDRSPLLKKWPVRKNERGFLCSGGEGGEKADETEPQPGGSH